MNVSTARFGRKKKAKEKQQRATTFFSLIKKNVCKGKTKKKKKLVWREMKTMLWSCGVRNFFYISRTVSWYIQTRQHSLCSKRELFAAKYLINVYTWRKWISDEDVGWKSLRTHLSLKEIDGGRSFEGNSDWKLRYPWLLLFGFVDSQSPVNATWPNSMTDPQIGIISTEINHNSSAVWMVKLSSTTLLRFRVLFVSRLI